MRELVDQDPANFRVNVAGLLDVEVEVALDVQRGVEEVVLRGRCWERGELEDQAALVAGGDVFVGGGPVENLDR